MSSQKREREDDDEEDLAGGGYRGLGAAESPHRDGESPQTEDDDEEMRDLEDSDDDDLAFFGGGPVSSDSVSDSWMSAALLEAQQELSNALEPLGSLAVAWATPSGDLSAGFVRIDFNLLLLSTSFDRRAADCLGLRLERPLRVTLSFDAPHGTTTPEKARRKSTVRRPAVLPETRRRDVPPGLGTLEMLATEAAWRAIHEAPSSQQ